MTVLDFTSALYLGIQHPSRSLPPWPRLTQGVPAALKEPSGAPEVARQLAALQGGEQALLMPSTLHLFWDVFGMLSEPPVTFYLDAGVYAIARWGAERAACRGVTVRRFRHHDAAALRAQIRGQRKRPVVVVDGFCPGCGQAAPIAEYLDIIRHHGGLLVVDDTQALGILGEAPRPSAPYGHCGGGVLRWSGSFGPDVLVGASLAKGFGAPLAVLTGSAPLIRRFAVSSDTRVHCSPPSAAAIHAAGRALAINQQHGDALRANLAQRVRQFRQGAARVGWSASGGLFPVQTLRELAGAAAINAHERLARWGVKTVLSRSRHDGEARVSFLIAATHGATEIGRCVEILGAIALSGKTNMRLHADENRIHI